MKEKSNMFKFFKNRLTRSLCGAFLLLVLATLAFLWTAQIVFFEPRYIKIVSSEIEEQVLLLTDDLSDLDIVSLWDNPLRNISAMISGRVLLIDEKGDIIFSFSAGIPGKTDDEEVRLLGTQLSAEFHPAVIGGERIRRFFHGSERGYFTILAMGIPVQYQGRNAALIIYHSLFAVHTLLDINRRQLVVLSIILPFAACILVIILVRALQKVDTLQKEIIANVSHELRSPLSLIMGYTNMVRDITWNDDKERDDNLNLILREANRLSMMVDDIMDLSQLEAGCTTLHRAPVNLYEIVTQEVDSGKRAASLYNIKIDLTSFTETITANVDALKISSVLRNLLNNAINHTEDGGIITVTIDQKDSAALVSVANPGQPIPRKELDVIWERYQRVQHQAGRKEGTGIGLAIVRTILKAHGCKYGVVSENGVNTFWFSVCIE